MKKKSNTTLMSVTTNDNGTITMTHVQKPAKEKRLDDIAIGKELKRVRKEHNWKQKKLAEAVHCCPSYISTMETGRFISMKYLKRCYKKMGVEFVITCKEAAAAVSLATEKTGTMGEVA